MLGALAGGGLDAIIGSQAPIGVAELEKNQKVCAIIYQQK